MPRLLILLALLWAVPAPAQEAMTFEEEPALFVTVEPEDVFTGGAWVQGEIVVTVRMTSLYPFETLNVEVPAIEGAVVETLMKPRLRQVKSYAGTGFVLEQVLAVYPQSSGKLVIPAMRAVGHVEPERDRPLNFDDRSPEITLDIAGIDPSYPGDWWMVSPNVTMTETWSIPVDALRKGDVVRREITVTAAGVPHTQMQIPEHGRTRGIDFTDAGGTGRTERSPDGVVGTLTRAWDLKIGVGDTLYVAPMSVDYWHPGEGAARKAAVRGYRIEPLPADAAAIAAKLMAEANARHGGARLLALVAVVLVALPFAVLALAWLWAQVPTRADRHLRRAAAGATPEQIYRAVVAWADASGIAMRDLRHAGTPAIGGLLARLFAGAGNPVDGRRVARELARIGRRDRVAGVRESVHRLVAAVIGGSARLTDKVKA